MLKDQIDNAVPELNMTAEDIKAVLVAARKACRNMYKPWLLKQWVSGQVILPEDTPRVIQVVNLFTVWRKKHELFKDKTVSDYTFHELEDAIDTIRKSDIAQDDLSGLSAYTELEGVEIARRSGSYVCVSVSNKYSLAKFADGSIGPETNWCTKQPDTAASYLRKGPLYVILKVTEDKAIPVSQFEGHTNGMWMDERDRSITADHAYVEDDDFCIVYEKTWEEWWDEIVEVYSKANLEPPLTLDEYNARIDAAGVRDIPTFVRLSLADEVPCVLEL